jgi:adenylate cyclase
MQLAMSHVNERLKQLGLPQLEMGIGINTGEVVVGNIGSAKRTKYGVVGSQINLTYRIESYTVGGQILISESTLEELSSIVKIGGQRELQLKGVRQSIIIYDITGISGKYNLFLSKEKEEFFLLPEEIPLQYAVLDGKRISSTLFKGSLVKLSAKEAKVRCDSGGESCIPIPMSNIKLNLLIQNNQAELSEDIYAKIVERPAEDGSFYAHFTSRPPSIEALLNTLYKSVSTKI